MVALNSMAVTLQDRPVLNQKIRKLERLEYTL